MRRSNLSADMLLPEIANSNPTVSVFFKWRILTRSPQSVGRNSISKLDLAFVRSLNFFFSRAPPWLRKPSENLQTPNSLVRSLGQRERERACETIHSVWLADGPIKKRTFWAHAERAFAWLIWVPSNKTNTYTMLNYPNKLCAPKQSVAYSLVHTVGTPGSSPVQRAANKKSIFSNPVHIFSVNSMLDFVRNWICKSL